MANISVISGEYFKMPAEWAKLMDDEVLVQPYWKDYSTNARWL